METISACPHHGFDTWMLVNHFYDGMSPPMKQLLETICGGEFLSKHPDEAMDFLNYVAKPLRHGMNQLQGKPKDQGPRAIKGGGGGGGGGGMYALPEDTEMKAKLTILTRRLDELEMKNQHEMQSVNEISASQPSCFNCQSSIHFGEHCQEHAHVLNQNRFPINAPHSTTYNPNWKNHSNLPWNPKPPAYIPPGVQQQFGSTSTQQQLSPLSSHVEQAILNLSKVVGTFVEEQKVLNVQTNQKIEAVESSLNRKLDNMHSKISRLSNQQLQGSKKGKVPF